MTAKGLLQLGSKNSPPLTITENVYSVIHSIMILLTVVTISDIRLIHICELGTCRSLMLVDIHVKDAPGRDNPHANDANVRPIASKPT